MKLSAFQEGCILLTVETMVGWLRTRGMGSELESISFYTTGVVDLPRVLSWRHCPINQGVSFQVKGGTDLPRGQMVDWSRCVDGSVEVNSN